MGYVVLKFIEGKYLESTLNGSLRFTRNEHFIELEKQDKERGIGDKYEGSWSSPFDTRNGDTEIYMAIEGGEPFQLKNAKGVNRFRYSAIKDMPVCCFTLLTLQQDFDFDEKLSRYILKEEIINDLIEQFKGRRMVIFDMGKLLDKFEVACKKKQMSFSANKVKYYDSKIDKHPIKNKEFHQKPWKTLFYKDTYFSFQKEYRIVINVPHDDSFNFQLGDIRDIAKDFGVVSNNTLFPQIEVAKKID